MLDADAAGCMVEAAAFWSRQHNRPVRCHGIGELVIWVRVLLFVSQMSQVDV